jgi:hypothetical protein
VAIFIVKQAEYISYFILLNFYLIPLFFFFRYFYEFIRNEGPQKIKEVEQKWQNEVGEFEGINDFMNSHTSKSEYF